MSRVLTVGTFDLYHAGHTNFLRNCFKLTGLLYPKDSSDNFNLTVGLNSDDFVFWYKNKKPVYSYDERRALLSNNKYVYKVIENDVKTLESLLVDGTYNTTPKKYDILVIGSDWARKDYYAQIGVTQEWLDRKGILLCYIPYTEGISTTELKERILKSD